MFFTKWLFKNGIGSIGSTAKTWSRLYRDIRINNDESLSQSDRYSQLISTWTIANQKVRKYQPTDNTLIIEKSQGCLAVLMWELICDISENVRAISIDEKTFSTAAEVVYQCVMENAPEEILFTPAIFREIAMSYLNYRITATAVLEEQVMSTITYKVVTFYKDYDFSNAIEVSNYREAEKRYEGVVNSHSSREYSIWMAEMCNNRYVYIQFFNRT